MDRLMRFALLVSIFVTANSVLAQEQIVYADCGQTGDYKQCVTNLDCQQVNDKAMCLRAKGKIQIFDIDCTHSEAYGYKDYNECMLDQDCDKVQDGNDCRFSKSMVLAQVFPSDQVIPRVLGPDCEPLYEAAKRISDPNYCNQAGRQATLLELDKTQTGLRFCGEADMGNSSDGPTPRALGSLNPKIWQLNGHQPIGDAQAFAEQGYASDPCK